MNLYQYLNEDDLQACKDFQPAETFEAGEGAIPHCCPICDGLRYFCKTCSSDHHEKGWGSCKPNHARMFSEGIKQ